MIAAAVVVVLLLGFLTAASIGVIYLKPACPKCGSRAAVVYRKTKARKKQKRNKTGYTCEECARDFTLKGPQGVHVRAKLLLGLAAACLLALLANQVVSVIHGNRTLTNLREDEALAAMIKTKENDPASGLAPLYGDFYSAVYERTVLRGKVERFLDRHAEARRLASDDTSVTYAFRYGWLPSYRLVVRFDDKTRYLEKTKRYW